MSLSPEESLKTKQSEIGGNLSGENFGGKYHRKIAKDIERKSLARHLAYLAKQSFKDGEFLEGISYVKRLTKKYSSKEIGHHQIVDAAYCGLREAIEQIRYSTTCNYNVTCEYDEAYKNRAAINKVVASDKDVDRLANLFRESVKELGVETKSKFIVNILEDSREMAEAGLKKAASRFLRIAFSVIETEKQHSKEVRHQKGLLHPLDLQLKYVRTVYAEKFGDLEGSIRERQGLLRQIYSLDRIGTPEAELFLELCTRLVFHFNNVEGDTEESADLLKKAFEFLESPVIKDVFPERDLGVFRIRLEMLQAHILFSSQKWTETIAMVSNFEKQAAVYTAEGSLGSRYLSEAIMLKGLSYCYDGKVEQGLQLLSKAYSFEIEHNTEDGDFRGQMASNLAGIRYAIWGADNRTLNFAVDAFGRMTGEHSNLFIGAAIREATIRWESHADIDAACEPLDKALHFLKKKPGAIDSKATVKILEHKYELLIRAAEFERAKEVALNAWTLVQDAISNKKDGTIFNTKIRIEQALMKIAIETNDKKLLDQLEDPEWD